MKRTSFFILALLLLFSFATLCQASVDNIYEVAIVNIKGDVQVDTTGEGTWIKPWIGMKLMEDALISTGSGSSVDIVFDAEGLNVARIKDNTQTTVKKALLELENGKVLADFANLKGGSTFTIKTPTAACAIRGSAYMVEADGDNGSWVYVLEGPVYVRGLDANGNPVGSESQIMSGYKVYVDKDGNIGQPQQMDADEIEQLEGIDPDVEVPEVPYLEIVDTKDLSDIVDTKDEDDDKEISPSDSSDNFTPPGFEPPV